MPEEKTPVSLRLRDLSKSYGDVKAVRNLTLDIFKGEVFGFLGPNGAGKTTTIHMICGLLKSDSGEVFIQGKSLNQFYRQCKSSLGLCPQNLIVWETLTCLEQLEFMGRQYNVSQKTLRNKVRELLDLLGLYDKRRKLAKTLSGGMKRRLNLALGLVHDPDILILDEPQAGLDPQSRILVREYIRSLARHKTIILTTHEMYEADQLSDRIAIIDHGQLLVLDTPEKLKSRMGRGDILEIKLAPGQHQKISPLIEQLPRRLRHLSLQNDSLHMVDNDILDILPILIDKLRKGNIKTEDVKIRKKTLEDVFISLTGRRLRE